MTTVYENKCMYYEKSRRAKKSILPRIMQDHLGSIRVVLNDTGGVDSWSDYYPFGKISRGSVSSISPKEKFIGQPFDDEIGLSNLGVRYYNADIGRFLTNDPLAGAFAHVSPYNYSMNNPIRLIDPTGKSPADFYDQDGKYLGTDKKDDKKVYVVTDKKEAKKIKATDKKGGATQVDEVTSAVELPGKDTRQAMTDVVSQDAENPFREYGGLVGPDGQVVEANPGEQVDPSVVAEAGVNVFGAKDKSQINFTKATSAFHSHPSGTVTQGRTTYSFAQDPAKLKTDFSNATDRSKNGLVTGNSYVFGMGDKKVYIYNGTGTIATFPLKLFPTVGK